MSRVPLAFDLVALVVLGSVGMAAWARRRASLPSRAPGPPRPAAPWRDGAALSGAHMAAVSLVGLPGLVAVAGIDGVLLAAGFAVATVLVMVALAEAVNRGGGPSIGALVAERFGQGRVRLAAAGLASLVAGFLCLVAGLVGAGSLGTLLFGGPVLGLSPAVAAIVAAGAVAAALAALGGQLGAAMGQSAKTALLLAATVPLAALTVVRFGGSLPALVRAAADGAGRGGAYLTPDLGFGSRLDLLSLGLAVALGTAGLPQVTARLVAAPGPPPLRAGLRWAAGLTGAMALTATVLGLGAAALVGSAGLAADRSGNLAGALLARALGGGGDTFGGDLLLALTVAIAAAAVLAMLAGTVVAATVGAAADLAEGPGGQLAARLAGPAMVVAAVLAAAALQGRNAALLLGLGLAVAASGNVPVLVLALVWPRLTATGALAGILTGLGASLLLILVGPFVLGPDGLVLPGLAPLFPLANPAIVAVPLGLAGAWVGSVRGGRRPLPAAFERFRVRALTGLDLARYEPEERA